MEGDKKMREIIKVVDNEGDLEVEWDFKNLKNRSQVLMELELLKLNLINEYVKE